MVWAVIPHAGIQYAGLARQRAFNKLPKHKKVIFFAALHTPKVPTQDVYVWKDGDTPLVPGEHSYTWVRNELFDQLQPTSVTIVIPTSFESAAKYVQTSNVANDVLVIGTTDLTHHGVAYNYVSSHAHPQVETHQREDHLITAIVNADSVGVKSHASIACGPYAIYAVCLIAATRRLKGTVVEYYDSISVGESGIDMYTTPARPHGTNYVSYVSIVFTTSVNSVLDGVDPNA